MTQSSVIGTTIGGYLVEAQIGSGGLATVYRGLDVQLQRSVAIKVLAPRAATLPGFADRFRQEARLVANLRHPNIVQVYAFGEERGLTYMVQELLPGPTLEQYLQDTTQHGHMPGTTEILAIITQLAAALDAAHAAGIIHRDVKPANALWNADGALVLTDFGIAKVSDASVQQTQAGVVLGTPVYMAPEQGQGVPLTPVADIYALGVVLYELIAGEPPFTGATALAIIRQHVAEPPPPLQPRRPDLPPAVEAVVQRALAKAPGQRYASAGALAAALQQAWPVPAAGSTIHQQPTRRWTSPGPPTRPPVVATPVSLSGVGRPAQPIQALPVPAAQRSVRLLPLLAALLLVVFIGSALLAARGESLNEPQASTRPTAAATGVVLAPAPADTYPVAAVRTLLDAGVRDGRAGPRGETLLATLTLAQQALEQGERVAATAQLAHLQRTVLQEARAGALAPDLLRQTLSGIDAIADAEQLSLPLTVRDD